MGREQNKKGLDEINRNHDEKQNITEKEWALLEKYRGRGVTGKVRLFRIS